MASEDSQYQCQPFVRPDPEFERLLVEESLIELKAWIDVQLDDLRSEITRHHRDFESISAACTLVRHERLSAEEAIKIIQNIVG